MELLCLEKENEPYSVADVFLDDDRVLSNLLFLESKYHLKESYFDTIQKDLTASMRKEVSIWLLEVCMEEQCEEEVFPTAMCIMDRFLSLVQIQKSRLQLLATTCLLLSSKLVENQIISVEHLVMFTDYSVTCEEIRSWEYLVLGELGWDIHAVIPNHFLDLILRRLTFVDLNKRTMLQKHAELFISLCASEYQFFNYLPSVIASACLALVLDIHCYKENLNEILESIQEITKIETKIIEDTIDLLEDLIPSNRFHSTKNQSKRKRKIKNRPLINLNHDSDSDLELENNNEVNSKAQGGQSFESSCGRAAAAIKYESSNQKSIKNSLCNNESTVGSSEPLAVTETEANNTQNSNLNNIKNSKSNQSSSLTDDDDDQTMNEETSSSDNDEDSDEEIVLLDLTCFEKPICNKSISCKLLHHDCFSYQKANDVPGVLF